MVWKVQHPKGMLYSLGMESIDHIQFWKVLANLYLIKGTLHIGLHFEAFCIQ